MAKPSYNHAPNLECEVEVLRVVAGQATDAQLAAVHADHIKTIRESEAFERDKLTKAISEARARGNETLALRLVSELDDLGSARVPPMIGSVCNRNYRASGAPGRVTCPRCCAGLSVHVQWCNWLRARGWSFATEDALRRAS